MNSNSSALHLPVMVTEIIEHLKLKENGIYIDATFGAGGHTRKILGQQRCVVYGIDRDESTAKYAEIISKEYPENFSFINERFSNIKKICKDLDLHYVDGILVDLGVSSMQLDLAERGFSFYKDGPLTMKMDQKDGITAYDIINSYPQKDIEEIILKYGEEENAREISESICKFRRNSKIETTLELANIVKSAIKKIPKGKDIHPATKTFQAIRIATNDELNELDQIMTDGMDLLNIDGHLLIITFHGLEDVIVKENIKKIKDGYLKPKKFILLNKNVIRPSFKEKASNRRARSAKLRVIRRIE